jgi:flavin-binding protein dodecin
MSMSDHVYKIIELVGTSDKGVSEAIDNAIARAGKSVRNIRWFETTQFRGSVHNGKVTQYQVSLRAGFTLED